MKRLMLQMLGFDLERIPAGAETEFTWTHAPASWGVFVFLAVAVALLYGSFRLYRRESDLCPPRIKRILAVLRLSTLLLLLGVLLGPALSIVQKHTVDPHVILLLDDSASMTLPAHYHDATAARVAAATRRTVATVKTAPPTRAETVDHVLRHEDAAFVHALAARGKVRVFSISDRLLARDIVGLERPRPHGIADKPMAYGTPLPPLEARGPSTDLARGIRDSLKLMAGHPVAGIVLFSDGQSTAGGDPLAAADFAAGQEVPVFTVGVGDPMNPRNVKVAEVWAPENVFRGDPFRVQARLEGESAAGLSARVELVERRRGAADSGRGTVAETQTVRFSSDAATMDITFEHEPEAEGHHVYTVRLVPAEPDLEADNSKSVAVQVVGRKARVLLVAGAPLWDFRLVRNLLIRDKTIDVSCWLQSLDMGMAQDGNTVIERLPRSPEELFAYDVIVLMDPDPREFDDDWIHALKRFVDEHAGGLMWVAGQRFTPDFLSHVRTREIRELLPVVFDAHAAGHVHTLNEARTREWPLVVTPAGADHPVLAVEADPARNLANWRSMPGLYWAFPAEKTKPGSRTLIEHGNPGLRRGSSALPVLVAGQYGGGRSVYLGFHSTWRWRSRGETWFDGFWVKAVRHLVEGRLLGARKRGRLTSDRAVYPVGATVKLAAKLYGADVEPLKQEETEVVLRSAAGREVDRAVLRAVPGSPGEFRGTLTATRMGITEAEVVLPDGPGGETSRVTHQFRVELPRIEFADARLDRALLRDVAARSGGRYFEVDAVDQVVEAIPDRRQTLVVSERPEPLWDTNRLLMLTVLLLSAEWALRKRYRLM